MPKRDTNRSKAFAGGGAVVMSAKENATAPPPDFARA